MKNITKAINFENVLLVPETKKKNYEVDIYVKMNEISFDSPIVHCVSASDLKKDKITKSKKLFLCRSDEIIHLSHVATQHPDSKTIWIERDHADDETVFELIQLIRKKKTNPFIIVGNIHTFSAARNLRNAGAQCVMVGGKDLEWIGMGVPLLTALHEISNLTNWTYGNTRPYIIADLRQEKISAEVVLKSLIFADFVYTGEEYYEEFDSLSIDLKEGMRYLGVSNLKELKYNKKFVEVK